MTGGGEAENKKLTPLEEKLMALLSWLSVKGTAVQEVGLEMEGVGNRGDHTAHESDDLNGDNHLPSTSYKRCAEANVYPKAKRKTLLKEKLSNLDKAAEAYALGQRKTFSIFEKLLTLKNASDGNLREKESDLKEVMLKIGMLEVKNKARELDLKETELDLRDKELNHEEENRAKSNRNILCMLLLQGYSAVHGNGNAPFNCISYTSMTSCISTFWNILLSFLDGY